MENSINIKKTALILSLLIIFTSCEKAELKKDDISEVTTIEQEHALEIVDEKTERNPVAEVEPNPQIGVINDTHVRLRSEPNLQSETLEYLNTGEKLTILDKSREQQVIGDMEDYWYKVQSEDSPEGWVYGTFVDIKKDYEITWVDSEFERVVRETLGKSDDIITKSDLDSINRLEFMGENIVQIDDIVHFKKLTELVLQSYKNEDLNPLSALKNLSYLYLSSNIISDLSPLSDLTNLTDLRIVRCDKISDLSPLSGLINLTILTLFDCEISDLSPLSGLTNLTNLNLNENQISDINALANLTNLTNLNLVSNQISDINALASLTNLAKLDLANNKISALNPLSDLTNLSSLILTDNQISDISALSDLSNLRTLALRSNQVSNLNPLANLTNLAHLYLNDNEVSNVSALSNLLNLQKLALEDTIDVSPLSGISNLRISPYFFVEDL